MRDAYNRAGEEIALLRKFICYKGLAGEYVIFEREKRGQECTEDEKKESILSKYGNTQVR